MKKVILPEAYKELDKAIDYYEEKKIGLGRRLLNEVQQHIEWINENPTIPRVRDGGYQRVNLKVFPYYIAYMLHEETLWILAIAHSHQKPEYFIQRKTEIY